MTLKSPHYQPVSDPDALENIRAIRAKSPAWQARGEKIAQKAKERWANPEFREQRVHQLCLENKSRKKRGHSGRFIHVGKKKFKSVKDARAFAHQNGFRLRITADHEGEFYKPAAENGAKQVVIMGEKFPSIRECSRQIKIPVFVVGRYHNDLATPYHINRVEQAYKEYKKCRGT